MGALGPGARPGLARINCRYIDDFESGFAPLCQQYVNIVKMYSYARKPSNTFCSLSTFRLGKEQPRLSGHWVMLIRSYKCMRGPARLHRFAWM